MSILLDAITRKKQQQPSNIVDVVATPRAHQSSQPKVSATTKKISVLALAISLGIGAAWGMSRLLQPAILSSPMATLPVINPNVNPQVNTADVTMRSNGNIEQALSDKGRDAQARDDQYGAGQGYDPVRLAGKVALPLAQPYTPHVNQTSIDVNTESNASAYNDTDSSHQIVSAQDDEQYERSDTRSRLNQTHANRKDQAEVEALRLQVNAAANEVDFASVRAPNRDESNNLLADFQMALKDVEYEKSVNQQVTPAKLDPIPRPTNQQIAKYGDLPASIQLQVPEFNINAHVYSSEPANRWLNVDGLELQQGDRIKEKLTIIEIRPRDIILEIDGEQFRVPAI